MKDFAIFDLRVCATGLEGYYWDFPIVIGGAKVVTRVASITRTSPLAQDVKSHSCALFLVARGIDIAHVKLKAFSLRPFVDGSVLSQDGVALRRRGGGRRRDHKERGSPSPSSSAGIAAHHLARALRLRSSDLTGYACEVRRSRVGRHLLRSACARGASHGPKGEGV